LLVVHPPIDGARFGFSADRNETSLPRVLPQSVQAAGPHRQCFAGTPHESLLVSGDGRSARSCRVRQRQHHLSEADRVTGVHAVAIKPVQPTNEFHPARGWEGRE